MIDLCLLAVDLRVDIDDVSLRNRDLRLRLIDGDPVVAIVNAGQQIACIDMLVIGDGHRGNIAAHFRRDRKAARSYERIVGRFKMADLQPVRNSANQRDQQHACRQACQDPMLAQPLSPRLLAGRWLRLRGFSAARGFRRLLRVAFRLSPEADTMKRKISIFLPLARGLIGKPKTRPLKS